MEPDRVLAGHQQPRILEHAERGRVRHMGVQHAAYPARPGMDRGMDEEGGILDRPIALQDIAGEIDHQEVARPDLRPVQAMGGKQETVVETGDHQGEVVVDPLVQPEHHRQAVACRKVDPRLLQCLCQSSPHPPICASFELPVQTYSP
jgi:hypothetical protein